MMFLWVAEYSKIMKNSSALNKAKYPQLINQLHSRETHAHYNHAKYTFVYT